MRAGLIWLHSEMGHSVDMLAYLGSEDVIAVFVLMRCALRVRAVDVRCVGHPCLSGMGQGRFVDMGDGMSRRLGSGLSQVYRKRSFGYWVLQT